MPPAKRSHARNPANPERRPSARKDITKAISLASRSRRRNPSTVVTAVLTGMGLVALDREDKTGSRSEIATEARVRVAERMMAAGLTVSEFEAWALKEWGLGEVSVGIVLDKMHERWRQHDAVQVPNLRAKYRRALQLVQQQSIAEMADGPKAMRAQHARNVIKCIDQLCRLDGVYEPDVVQVNVGATPELEEVADALDNLAGLIALARSRETAPPLDVEGSEVPALPDVTPS